MKILYSKSTERRSRRFQIYTMIVEENHKKYSLKKATYKEGKNHIYNIAKNYELLNAIKPNLFVEYEWIDDNLVFPFVNGESWAYSKRKMFSDKKTVKNFFKEWKQLLILSNDNIAEFEDSAEFREVFGEGKLYDKCEALKITNFDCILDNIIENEEELKMIDYEWVFDFLVPLELSWYRLVKFFYENYYNKIPFLELLSIAGIDVSKIESYDQSLGNFEKWIMVDKQNNVNYGKLGDQFKKPTYKKNETNDKGRYRFSKELLELKGTIIIYGAGDVGHELINQIVNNRQLTILGWVDKNYIKYKEQGEDIKSVHWILNCEYDYIIIAVFDYMTAEVIKQELIELGVDSNKVIWKKPLMN